MLSVLVAVEVSLWFVSESMPVLVEVSVSVVVIEPVMSFPVSVTVLPLVSARRKTPTQIFDLSKTRQKDQQGQSIRSMMQFQLYAETIHRSKTDFGRTILFQDAQTCPLDEVVSDERLGGLLKHYRRAA